VVDKCLYENTSVLLGFSAFNCISTGKFSVNYSVTNNITIDSKTKLGTVCLHVRGPFEKLVDSRQ
jgi:hypothetical protein